MMAKTMPIKRFFKYKYFKIYKYLADKIMHQNKLRKANCTKIVHTKLIFPFL
jgi:hypothetical protein